MDFFKIETLFCDNGDRTIEKLSNIYNNNSLLKEKIRKIGIGILDNKSLIKGKKILIKPNWVSQNRKEDDAICLRTNDSFLLTVIELLLENAPDKITIGDAPIQSCDWQKMLSEEFYASIKKLSIKYSISIEIKDFRRITFDAKRNNLVRNIKPISDYTIFDLGNKSYLEPISSVKANFRVTSYNPDRLAESHKIGMHKYCITKEIFAADIIISLPKIKTHQKTGLTCALKNTVGLNGDKDYLPHHRLGGDKSGGDCYPGKNVLRRISEFAFDYANRNKGNRKYWLWFHAAILLWRLSNPKNVHQIAAGWYGNDTCWRTVMDLNKIAVFGKKDGTLSSTPQRQLYSLCDGIIGGQGDGPLNPQPLPLGIIGFSNNNYLCDVYIANIMRLKDDKIPLLNSAKKNTDITNSLITLNGEKSSLIDLQKISIQTILPPGWINYLKSNENSNSSQSGII